MLESLFNKTVGLKACNFIKKTPVQVHSCEYCKTLKNTYFEEHLRITNSEIVPEHPHINRLFSDLNLLK